MLEVCFSNAVKLGLRQAQCPQDPKDAGQGAISIYCHDGKKPGGLERRKEVKQIKDFLVQQAEQAIPLGGKPDDLIGLIFVLSRGDIASPLTRETCPGKQTFFHDMLMCSGENIEEDRIYAEQLWQSSMDDMAKLKARVAAGEPVRIWADYTPDGACGLLFTAELLCDCDCPVTVVYPPTQFEGWLNTVTHPNSWQDVPLELFGRCLDNEQVLTKERISLLAQQWRHLKEENAVLRAVKDQSVVSADESYYDDLIRKKISETTCSVAQVTGDVLNEGLGIPDWMVEQRVKILLSQGALEICDNNAERFGDTIIKCGK